MNRLFSFDYDGVIVDSLDRLVLLVTEAQESVGEGRPPTVEDFRTIPNLTMPDMGRRLGISETNLPRFIQCIFEIQASNKNWPKLFLGMDKVLRSVAQIGNIVIVTSTVEDEVHETLRLNGLEGIVKEMLDGQDPRSKAERITYAAKKYNAELAKSFMIGDSASDIRHGKSAGVKTIAVTWGYQLRELLGAEKPDYFAETPNDILEIIK